MFLLSLCFILGENAKMRHKRKVVGYILVCLFTLFLLYGQGSSNIKNDQALYVNLLNCLLNNTTQTMFVFMAVFRHPTCCLTWQNDIFLRLDELDHGAARRSPTGNICTYQEPFVRIVPESFKTTVQKSFVAPCGYLANGVPINSERNLCRFTR